VAVLGDGWYGFNLAGVDAVRERLACLDRLCAEAGRELGELDVAVALEAPAPEDAGALREAGVSELVLIEMPPEYPDAIEGWADALVRRWSAAIA